jgi:hypothetical protein
MKWHYVCKENVIFEESSFKSGKYYCYDIDVFDYLINDPDWVSVNNAYIESDWILSQLDKMIESNNGALIFIPTPEVADKIDRHYNMQDEV